MPIVFKLIGQFKDNKMYQIKDPFEGQFNIKLLIELYTFWGLSPEEINRIKFITDSDQINHPDKNFLVKPDEDRVIFVFSADPELRNKLVELFIKEGGEYDAPDETKEEPTPTQPLIVDPEICKPITSKDTDSIPKLTDELINTMNVKAVSLFSDPDFKSLISIYLRKPELFGTLAQYVQHGNIVEESLIPPKTMDELSDEELANYQSLADKINHLEIGVTNDIIINKLIKYSGHLNLALRSILYENATSLH